MGSAGGSQVLLAMRMCKAADVKANSHLSVRTKPCR